MAAVTVAVLAYRSPGYPVTNVNLNDGGVWVTYNDAADRGDPPLGRFDNPIRQLDLGTTPPGPGQDSYRVDVFQSGTNVLLLDQRRWQLYPVSGALGVPLAASAVAISSTDSVALGGATAAVLDPQRGKLWAASLDSMASLDPRTARPSASVGPDAAMTVGVDGTVYGASIAAHRLTVLRPEDAEASRTELPAGFKPTRLTLTAVGSTAVLLDLRSRTLAVPSRGLVVHLPRGTAPVAPVLQQPGPAADVVLVADAHALYAVPLRGGAVVTLSRAGNGLPASPVRLGGCDFAAWAGGAATLFRACDRQRALTTRIPAGATGVGRLVFRVNRNEIVLNEPDTGAIWSVEDVQKLDNWDAVRQQRNDRSKRHRFRNRVVRTRSTRDRAPVAKPDALGARFGQSTILHVLDNDFDPDGDVLAISQVTQPDTTVAHVDVVENGQALELRFNGTPPGDVHLRYTVDDGRGKEATAAVSVHLYPSAENAAPTPSPAAPRGPVTVAGGESVTLPLLSDWRDRDGDPLFIAAATASQGLVSVSGDALVYTAPPSPGTQHIRYAVGDGAARTKRSLAVHVLGSTAKPVPPTALPDVVSTTVGTPVTFAPLANDAPGADPTDPGAQLALAGDVTAQGGVAVTTNQLTGAVTADADAPGTYLLTYTAAFGTARPSVGRIRLDVAPAAAARQPIALPDTAVLHGDQPIVVDPIANDVDPQNALLVVQSASPSAGGSVEVAVEHHHWLVIQAKRRQLVDTGGVGSGVSVVHYTVTDGLTAPVQGDVVVTQEAASIRDLPPIPHNDEAVVRAGGSVEVPVLGNDSDPENDQLALLPGKLVVHVSDGRARGSAWAVGGVVRYVAPPPASTPTPRRVTVDYQVRDSAQNTATGQVAVTVNPATALHDSPPSPLPLEARVDAGQQVTLHVPVYNVDPDGDSVTVTGVTVPPKRGRIVASGTDTLVYQAYPDPALVGPDTFTYQVTDPYGQSGTATVRLTVAPPAATQPPVAHDDEAAAAPGTWLHVDVLANDLVADGDPVRLSLAPGRRSPGARVSGNRLLVRAPAAGAPAVRTTYVLEDGSGARSTAVATVRGIAKLDNPPVARDDYVDQPRAGVRTVAVDVRRNDDDPDTPRASLHVAPAGAGARALGNGRLLITIGPRPRLVPYQLSDGTKESRAYVHVPGANLGRPVLRRGAPAIEIPAGGRRTISVETYVADPRGRVRLTTRDRVQATPEAYLSATVTGPETLSIHASGRYRGPGSVTFEVTDGRTLGDPTGRRAVLSLPVRIGPEAPQLRCPSAGVSLVVGAAPTTIDLASLCRVWLDDPGRLGALRYATHVTGAGNGLTLARLDRAGRRVTLRAGPAARPGATVALAITATGVGHAGAGSLPIVAVAAPPATTAPTSLTGAVGQRLTVDLAGSLTSPFGSAATPRVLGVSHPTGATVSASGTTLTILPKVPGTITVDYRITDVAARPARAVIGSVTVRAQRAPSVVAAAQPQPQKKQSQAGSHKAVPGSQTTTAPKQTQPKPPPQPQPEAPAAPGVPFPTNVASAQVVLAWTVPDNRGSPIDQYRVQDEAGDTWSCPGTPCTLDTKIRNGTTYRFKVQAHNSVDWGPWSDLSQPATPDEVPGIVGSVSASVGDGNASVSWAAPSNSGSPVDQYEVTVSPGVGDPRTVGAGTTSVSWNGLANGTAYSFRVRAHNAKGWGDWSQESVAVTPFGAPAAVPAPTASGADSADLHEKAIQVSWKEADGNGRAITAYVVTPTSSKTGAGQPQTVGGGATTATFSVPNDGASWTYTVAATNAGGKSSPASPPSQPIAAHTRPDPISQVTAADSASGAGLDGSAKLTFVIPQTNGLPVTRVQWQSSGGGTGTFALPPATAGTSETQTVTGLTNGTTYTFQVQACNDDGCGALSPPSNAVVPYGAPGPPSAGANANGTSITFSWSGGGGAGRPVANYQVNIDGTGWNDVGASAGQTTRTYGYSETHSIQARVVDSAGQTSGGSNTASARTVDAPPPPPAISISRGAPYSGSGCTDPSCAYVNVQMSHFAPNTSYDVSICGTGGGSGCQTFRRGPTDGAGNLTINNYFYYGWRNTTVTISAGGVSASMTW